MNFLWRSESFSNKLSIFSFQPQNVSETIYVEMIRVCCWCCLCKMISVWLAGKHRASNALSSQKKWRTHIKCQKNYYLCRHHVLHFALHFDEHGIFSLDTVCFYLFLFLFSLSILGAMPLMRDCANYVCHAFVLAWNQFLFGQTMTVNKIRNMYRIISDFFSSSFWSAL